MITDEEKLELVNWFEDLVQSVENVSVATRRVNPENKEGGRAISITVATWGNLTHILSEGRGFFEAIATVKRSAEEDGLEFEKPPTPIAYTAVCPDDQKP